jgi:hypothetical protein
MSRIRLAPLLVLLGIGAAVLFGDEPQAETYKANVKGPELGRGTFRVFASSDPTAEPIAWVWRRPDIHAQCRMEFWILRTNYVPNQPAPNKAAEDLWFRPSALNQVLDHVDSNGQWSFDAFHDWVLLYGSRTGGSVPAGDLGEQWVHTIARLP